MSAGPFGAPLEPFEDIIGQSKDNPGRLRDSTRSFLDSIETFRGMHTENFEGPMTSDSGFWVP